MPTIADVQTEVDAAYLYGLMAIQESDPVVASIFRTMQDIETDHARAFMRSIDLDSQLLPGPSVRAKLIKKIGDILGYDWVLGILLDTEKALSRAIVSAKMDTALPPALSDFSHVAVLQNLVRGASVSPHQLARFEKRHRTVGGNALRAAVLGGNDGLVSNFCLIMGVAGANADSHLVMLTGIAGLLAGALSMALGEWVSVKSSQELVDHQIAIESEEIAINPDAELRELALIYRSKGISEAQAFEMAQSVFNDPEMTRRVLVQEELGIQLADTQGSPLEAALTSFVLFAIGAMIPLLPFLFGGGWIALAISVGLSALGLFGIGAVITLFTGKSVLQSGLRQVAFGGIAAAVTFGIGRLLGVGLVG